MSSRENDVKVLLSLATRQPEVLGLAHDTLVSAARDAKQQLLHSIEGGTRGANERAKQLRLLLNYQEYLLAADILVGYEKRDAAKD